MASTIAEIAARAGVSPGTVSRILNKKTKGERPAIAKRVERIHRLARQMGYRPNLAARSVVTGRFKFSAFVTCRDRGSHWIARGLLHGIHDELEKIGYRLVFNEVPVAHLEDPKFVPTLLRESSVDALLVAPNNAFTDHTIELFEASGTPIVWLNFKHSKRAVYPDDLQGVRMAVESLVALGHREIAFFPRAYVVADPYFKPHYSEVDRVKGFKKAMAAAGLKVPPLPIEIDAASTLSLERRANLLLDHRPNLTAVICYGMEEAIVLHTTAIARGKKMPDSLKIVAFSDGFIPAMTGLPIATIPVPFEEVGRESVRMMSQVLDGEKANAASVAVPFQPILWPVAP